MYLGRFGRLRPSVCTIDLQWCVHASRCTQSCAPNVTGSVVSCAEHCVTFFSMACTEVPGFTSHRCLSGVIFLNACVLVCCTRRFRPEQVFWHSSAHVVHFTLTLQKHVSVTLSLSGIQGARSHNGVAPYALQMAPSFQPVSRGRICALTLATCNVAISIVFVDLTLCTASTFMRQMSSTIGERELRTPS